jgi:(2R)-ethylmalonyl-CoA mutase
VVIEAKTAELREAAWAELQDVLERGGAFDAVDELKGRLVRSMAERTRRIESGEQVVVGVNAFTETSRVAARRQRQHPHGRPRGRCGDDGRRGQAWRASRDQNAVDAALAELRRAAEDGTNIMGPSIALAKAGGTTGEWARRCARCSASTAPPPACRPRWASVPASWLRWPSS